MMYELSIDGRTIGSDDLDHLIAVVQHLRTEKDLELQETRARLHDALQREMQRQPEQWPTLPTFKQVQAERDAAVAARDQALKLLDAERNKAASGLRAELDAAEAEIAALEKQLIEATAPETRTLVKPLAQANKILADMEWREGRRRPHPKTAKRKRTK